MAYQLPQTASLVKVLRAEAFLDQLTHAEPVAICEL